MPQLLLSVFKLISHPLASLPSLLANPVRHELTVQVPLEQAATALGSEHEEAQEPQWVGSVFRLTSHPLETSPSQFAMEEAQTNEQTEETQVVAVEFTPESVRQFIAHEPQRVASVETSTSHPLATWPSQFCQGATHAATVQLPPEQPAVACAKLHLVPQELQLLGSI